MRTISFKFLVTLTIILFSTTITAGDWQNFLGPNRNSMSSETGINKNWKSNPPKTLWTVDLYDNGYSGPSVADGKMFIIDRKKDNAEVEVVRAIDVKTGKDIWTYPYPDPGKENRGYGRTTPTYDNGKLYTISRNNLLHCFNADTGKKLWSIDLISKFNGKAPTWLIAASPVIDGDRLIVCPGGKNGVVVLNKNTGKTIWKGGNKDKLGYATPVIAVINGKKQYVIFTGKNLIGVDPENGKVLWSYQWITKYDVNAAAPLVIDEKLIFITSGYKKGCAMLEINGKNVKKIWFNKNVQAHFNSPILYKGYIYGNSNPDHLKCIIPKTGKVKWEEKGFEKGGLIIVDGVIIALGGKTGELVMVEASPKYKELGRITPLGGRSWTAPIISDKKLFIRNLSQMTCLDLAK